MCLQCKPEAINSQLYFFFQAASDGFFLRLRYYLEIYTHKLKCSHKTALKVNIKKQKQKRFDILLEKQKNTRRIKCFILHWLLHKNMITLILCWGDEKNKWKFACVWKLLLILHLWSHLWPRISKQTAWNAQKKPLNNWINSNKIRKDGKLLWVLTESEENDIKTMNYSQ